MVESVLSLWDFILLNPSAADKVTPADYTLEIEFLESDTNKLIHNLITSIKVSGE